MADILDLFLQASFWTAALRIASPYIFGTLGVLICERAGILNLGIEGIMTFGAMVGWMTVYQGGGLWSGVAVALACGAVMGLLHGGLTVFLGLSQHVSGLGITLLAGSLSAFIYRMILPHMSSPPGIETFQPLPIPLLSHIPFLGPALFSQTALTYLALALVALVAWILYRTPLGLALRMVGENPAAVEAQGLSVIGLRMAALAAGSALMALAGAFLTLSAFNAFFFSMVNGRGWICIALVVFASWRPGKALLGAILFASFDAFQMRLQHIVGSGLPYQIFLMLPYALSILALVGMARRASYPRALMQPYRKGER